MTTVRPRWSNLGRHGQPAWRLSAHDFPDQFEQPAPRGDAVLTFGRDGDNVFVTDFRVHWGPGGPSKRSASST